MEYWKIPYSPAEIKGTASLVPNKKAEGGGGGASYEQEEKGKKKRRRGIAYNQLDQRGKREREVKKRSKDPGFWSRKKPLLLSRFFLFVLPITIFPFSFPRKGTLVYTRERMNKIRERSES